MATASVLILLFANIFCHAASNARFSYSSALRLRGGTSLRFNSPLPVQRDMTISILGRIQEISDSATINRPNISHPASESVISELDSIESADVSEKDAYSSVEGDYENSTLSVEYLPRLSPKVPEDHMIEDCLREVRSIIFHLSQMTNDDMRGIPASRDLQNFPGPLEEPPQNSTFSASTQEICMFKVFEIVQKPPSGYVNLLRLAAGTYICTITTACSSFVSELPIHSSPAMVSSGS